MTEKEIVKSLRCCADGDCKDCAEDKQGCQENLLAKAAEAIERLIVENAALREKQRWIPVAERPPEEQVLVNVVWVNRVPELYYKKIKGVPFSDTACF